MQATQMIPERLRDQVKIKAFGVGPEAKGDPQKHGEFDNKQFWIPDFWEPKPSTGGADISGSAGPVSTAASLVEAISGEHVARETITQDVKGSQEEQTTEAEQLR